MRFLALCLTCSKLQDLDVGSIINSLDTILQFKRYILEWNTADKSISHEIVVS